MDFLEFEGFSYGRDHIVFYMDNVSNSFRKMGINLDAPSQRVNLPMLTNI